MRMMKNAARILVFAVLLALLLGMLSDLLELKESTQMLEPFLEYAQEYDVLFIGDSQVLNGILPLELYHKYGIASYNLGSGNSRIPVSYWKMINALDYVTPKVIVLSVTDIELPEFPTTEGEWLHVAFDGFPMTLNKAKAIMDLTNVDREDEYGVPFKEIRKELFFLLIKYHSRWKSLEERDFKPQYNTVKGGEPFIHVSDPRYTFKLAAEDECLPEEGCGYVYLRKFIEECQRRNIPLVLNQPPYPINLDAHKATHTAEKIAKEYGVPMLNFTDTNDVVDYYVDGADPGSHLNPSGARKLTDYMGRYLKDHYELPDRREDAAYAHWNDEWNAYVDGKIKMIAEEADSLRARLMLLHDEDFNLVLTVRPNFQYDHRNTKVALQNIARRHVFEGDEQISERINPLAGLNEAEAYNEGYMIIVDRDAGDEEAAVWEFYGIGEREFETSFGYVFCRMDGEWIDLSITPEDGEEVYYFDNWDDQDQDMRLVLIDRRTGKPALVMPFSREEDEEP